METVTATSAMDKGAPRYPGWWMVGSSSARPPDAAAYVDETLEVWVEAG